MTKLSTEALAAVETTRQRWRRFKDIESSAEAIIRARVAEELGEQIHQAKLDLANSLRDAIAVPTMTKVALRSVTTKHPGTLEKYLSYGSEPERVLTEAVSSVGLSIEWWERDGSLLIVLDPRTIVSTTVDRDEPRFWHGHYTVITRQADGMRFVRPVDDESDTGEGITEWLRDRSHTEVVLDWVDVHPR
ncbi:hypothetical protein [Pseudolysinimonas sp.]|uniref:hypothetical protein n=1 Tax=Pseudolysinimonas sp. TaxID=2680009 RepID=UPI003F7E508B